MDKPNEFLNKLFEIRDTSHVVHLHTKNYNEHKILGTFYGEIVDLADCFAEQYQGYTDSLITDIGSIQLREGIEVIPYLEECRSYCEEIHSSCMIITVKLVIESILTCLNSTLYLLRLN